MRASLIAALQTSVYRGVGEWVRIYRPGGRGVPRRARAIWMAAGSVESGTEGAQVVSERDQFSFRRRDTAAVAAAVRGSVIEREASGDRYVVAGEVPGRAEQVRVYVTEEGR